MTLQKNTAILAFTSVLGGSNMNRCIETHLPATIALDIKGTLCHPPGEHLSCWYLTALRNPTDNPPSEHALSRACPVCSLLATGVQIMLFNFFFKALKPPKAASFFPFFFSLFLVGEG